MWGWFVTVGLWLVFALGVDFLDQRPQEWFHVRHEPCCLKTSPVPQFDDRRWVDVDTDNGDPGGE